jgi:hypothetical protein
MGIDRIDVLQRRNPGAGPNFYRRCRGTGANAVKEGEPPDSSKAFNVDVAQGIDPKKPRSMTLIHYFINFRVTLLRTGYYYN